MTEYELDRICERTACDCKCAKCPIMAKFMRSELGLDEYDEENDEW